MKTTLSLQYELRQSLPLHFQEDDVRYPEELVEFFIKEFEKDIETILDPFAGYGTTLVVAEAMGKQAYGIELNEQKVHYARARLSHPERLIHGDARHLATYDLPKIDFSMTSPPYTSIDDELDPLTDYSEAGRGYAAYLRDIRNIYGQLWYLMNPNAIIVIEVANIKRHGRVTTLAWDIAREISRIFHFEGEVILCWDRYGYGYDHSYCLVFRAI